MEKREEKKERKVRPRLSKLALDVAKAPRTFRRHSRRPSLTLDDTRHALPRTATMVTSASLCLSLRFYTRPPGLLSFFHALFSTVFHVLPSARNTPFRHSALPSRAHSPRRVTAVPALYILYAAFQHISLTPNSAHSSGLAQTAHLQQQARPLLLRWRCQALPAPTHVACAHGLHSPASSITGRGKDLEQPQSLDVATLRHFARHAAREAIDLWFACDATRVDGSPPKWSQKKVSFRLCHRWSQERGVPVDEPRMPESVCCCCCCCAPSLPGP